MFTGIIEEVAQISSIHKQDGNLTFNLTCPFVDELKVDQSVAHNGICLTVVELNKGAYKVVAIDETIKRTTIGAWKKGDIVNLERCMPATGRFDGHIVQGHIDTIGECVSIDKKEGSVIFRFSYSSNDITVEKGSIAINGVSLTVVDSNPTDFTVHVIPYTFKHTVFHQLKVGEKVNLEFDIIGKYLSKLAKRGN